MPSVRGVVKISLSKKRAFIADSADSDRFFRQSWRERGRQSRAVHPSGAVRLRLRRPSPASRKLWRKLPPNCTSKAGMTTTFPATFSRSLDAVAPGALWVSVRLCGCPIPGPRPPCRAYSIAKGRPPAMWEAALFQLIIRQWRIICLWLFRGQRPGCRRGSRRCRRNHTARQQLSLQQTQAP